MAKAPLNGLGSDRGERLAGAGFQPAQGPRFGGPQPLFALRPARLERMEVRRIGRQVQHCSPRRLDPLANPGDFVRRQIVPHHHIAPAQPRTQNLLGIGQENVTIGGGFGRHRRHRSAAANRAQNRQGSPGSGGDRCPLAARTAAAVPGPVCPDAAFVQQYQPVRADSACSLSPLSALETARGSVWFGRAG